MVAPSSHVHLPEGEQAEAVLDEQELLGSTVLVTPVLLDPESGAFESFSDLDRIKALAERFNRAAELARSRRMRVGYHNHAWEFGTDFDGRSGLEEFYALCETRRGCGDRTSIGHRSADRYPVDLVRRAG